MSQSTCLNLSERRALLRKAEQASNVHDFSAFAQALHAANEEDRAALTKTLPPSRLFNAEGASARACFILTALGKPKLVAETLVKAQSDDAQALLAGARERSEDWALSLCDELAEASGWGQGTPLELALTLQAERGLIASSAAYVQRIPYFLSRGVDRTATPQESGQQIVNGLQRHDGLLMHAFWQFFEIEGMGANYILTDWNPEAWTAAIALLSQSQPGFRERILDASLSALLRDFSAKNILWYVRLQRLLQPGAQEVAARQSSYLAVLASQPSTAVGLAQDMPALALQTHALDTDALIEASTAVLLRTEKKLIKAQLKLLSEIKTDNAQRERISLIVADALPSMPADLAEQARKLVISGADPKTQAQPDSTSTGTSAEAATAHSAIVSIAEPRRTPLPEADSKAPAIPDDEALFALLAQLLEGHGDGAKLPGILDYLAAHVNVTLPDALQKRAAEVIASLADERRASPRRLLISALLNLEGPGFQGYARYVFARAGQPDLEGVDYQESSATTSSYDPKTESWNVTETWTSRSGYQYLPTHAPTALLADVFKQLQRARQQGQPFASPKPVPAQTRSWQRQLAAPGEGTYSRDLEVLGNSPKPFWMVPGEPAVSPQAALHQRAIDVSNVPAEFTFRAQEAREQDGYDVIMQWAAWLLQANLDTLAAHAHPMLSAAVQVVNVRGLGALMTALGASHQPLGAPSYSALALAASAKMPEHRAQAAEAIAQLADSGLLAPHAFATQMAAHLADEFVMAGRLAQTLTDAASISAIAGFRTLQTLGALLPHLLDKDLKPLTQAGKLLELAARLSGEYGYPLTIPEPLLARSKGSSALAVALRTLEAVRPHTTPLAQQAAETAQAAQTRGNPS